MARRGGKKKSKRRAGRWAGRVFLLVLAGVFLLLLVELVTWPDVAALRTKRPETTAFIERYKSDHGVERVAQSWVPYDRISLSFKHAVLAGEDIGFLSHGGFEAAEIQDAVKDAVLEGKKLRGASTITQQLAKNLWLSPSRNPLRKAKEAILTRQLERHLSKKRILEIYMNVVELGPGVFGVESAAQRWFQTSASGLTEDQAITLAAMLPSPKKWVPGTEHGRYRRHLEAIRRRMRASMHLRERL